MAQIGLIVLGAFLALIGSIVVNLLQMRWSEKRQSTLFKTLLRDEIESITQCIENLLEIYNKTKVVYIEYTTQLQHNINFYDDKREYLVLFSNEELRKQISQFYLKLKRVNSNTTALISFSSSPLLTEEELNKRFEKQTDEYKEIKNQGEKLKEKLSKS